MTRARHNGRNGPGARGASGGHAAPAAEDGFTLIEIMTAFAILAFITSIMWGSFSQTATSKRTIEAAQDRAHTVRVALLRMAREIEMSYIADESTATTERRTMFVGSAHGDIDELTFSAFAHQRLRAGLNEGDTALITYFGERDPDDRRILNIMRRETRRLQLEDPKALAGESYILCPDVAKLKFSFYDYKKKEWESEWSTLSATGYQYPPSHVRITLTVVDERGQDATYSTDARIHMTERVGYRPVPK
jgi:general secretion pathway protein J